MSHPLDFLAQVRPWLELGYFFFGSLASIAILFGFWQLKMMKMQLEEMKKQTEESKNSLKISATRESFQLSAEQCQYFANTIVPMDHKARIGIPEELRNSFLAINIEVDTVKKEFRFDKSHPVNLAEIRGKLDFTNLLNHIEGFSSFFCSGVASEDVAFNTLGRAYCSTVKSLAPLTYIEYLHRDMWKNTYKLYFLWQNRIDSEEAKRQVINLDKQKFQLQEKLKSTGENGIPFIGS